MTAPFYALIIPQDQQSPGIPTHPIYYPPGVPTHPIYMPPGIWGGSGAPMPTPPIYLNPNPPGVPTHPIYYPPSIWGPTDPRPGYGLPGQPPGTWGGSNVPMPTPPIHLPPVEPGGPPVTIWPKPGPLPHPEHPIVLPPPPEGGTKPPPSDGGWGYSPDYGWGYFPAPDEPSPKG